MICRLLLAATTLLLVWVNTVEPEAKISFAIKKERSKRGRALYFSLSPVTHLTETGIGKLFGTPKTYSQAALKMPWAWPSALALASAAVADCVSKPAGQISSTTSKLVPEKFYKAQ